MRGAVELFQLKGAIKLIPASASFNEQTWAKKYSDVMIVDAVRAAHLLTRSCPFQPMYWADDLHPRDVGSAVATVAVMQLLRTRLTDIEAAELCSAIENAANEVAISRVIQALALQKGVIRRR